MRFNRARTAPLMLVLAMALLSGCPEPEETGGTIIRRKPTPTPAVSGNVGDPSHSSSPAGSIDSTLKTPTPFPTPTPSPTFAPVVTPPPVTQPTPSTTPAPVSSDPIGQ